MSAFKPILLISLLVWMTPTAWSQYDADSVAPPLNPYDSPWPTPDSPSNGNPPPSYAPPPGNDAPSYAPPVFDPYGSDADDGSSGFGGGGFGGGSASDREGKSSFVLEEPSDFKACDQWGNKLLGERVYSDYNDCRFALDRKGQDSKSLIAGTIDRSEREKLKSVIKGNLSREKSKEYTLDFKQLLETLDQEIKQGCLCVKNP